MLAPEIVKLIQSHRTSSCRTHLPLYWHDYSGTSAQKNIHHMDMDHTKNSAPILHVTLKNISSISVFEVFFWSGLFCHLPKKHGFFSGWLESMKDWLIPCRTRRWRKFQKRKVIGEIGCCESRMSEQNTDQLTKWLTDYLPNWLTD